MYKNGYVMAVIANGDVLNEDDSRQVCLPFGTEYKIRLINKNHERCAADLIINGEQIARFIVNGGETADIERFLDGSLNNGKRFKFVSLNDSGVKDKKDFDNGIIEVHFFKERKKPEPLIIKEEHHHHHWDKWPEPIKPYYPPYQPRYRHYSTCDMKVGDNVDMQYCSSKGTSIGNMSFNCCLATGAGLPAADGAPGATVRGSESTQKFSDVSGYEFESTATILKLKIVNGEIKETSRYCSGCGRKKRDGDKYCANCGSKL